MGSSAKSDFLNSFDYLATRRNRFAATAPFMAFLNRLFALKWRNPETIHGVSMTLRGSVNHGCVITSQSVMRYAGSPISIFATNSLEWSDTGWRATSSYESYRGYLPVSSMNNITPRLYISAASVYSALDFTSGD